MNKMLVKKYTAQGKKTDIFIEQLLKPVVAEIVQYVPEVVSVLLVGSFGKGEGSVIEDDYGNFAPLKDFDFLLIFNHKIPHDRIRNLTQNLRKNLAIKGSDGFAYTSFTVDINATTIRRINSFPDITTYEAKSSHLLYGKENREKITINREDIPLRSGARILFQKAISLIGQLPTTNYIYERRVPDDKKNMFIYACLKVFVELGTALTILGEIYAPSVRERSVSLKKNYKTLFPELYEKFPDLAEKIYQYTKLKLVPDFKKFNDPISLWFSARKYHKEVLKYYMQKYLNVESSDWFDFCLRTRYRLKQEFYTPIVYHYFQAKLGVRPGKRLCSLLNSAFQLYDNFQYEKNKIGYGQNLFKKRFSTRSPCIEFFIATLFILHSIKEDGQVDLNFLETARVMLGTSSKLSLNFTGNSWETTRSVYLNALDLMPIL
jgi:hypothetical protein